MHVIEHENILHKKYATNISRSLQPDHLCVCVCMCVHVCIVLYMYIVLYAYVFYVYVNGLMIRRMGE